MVIPVDGYENLPLCNVEHTMRCKVEEYCKIKQSRLYRLAELKSKVSMVTQNEKQQHLVLFLHNCQQNVRFGQGSGYVCKLQGLERRQLSSSSRDCLLWNLNVQYYYYRILPLDPILNQLNPFHIFKTCYFYDLC
jgi:hypothetical protein